MKTKHLTVLLSLLFVSSFIIAGNRYDNLAGSIQTFWSNENGLPSDRLLDIIQDETGYIWLASYDGLIRFNGTSFTMFSEKEHGFSGISPRVFCSGADGALWIGTNTSGLYKYKDKKFTHYGLQEGLPNLSIRTIKFDDNNTLWIGTAGGAAKLEADGTITPIRHDGKERSETVFFVLPIKDYVLAGTNLPGLKLIKDGKMYAVDYLKEIQTYSFSAGFLDFDGSVWLGTNSGKIFKINGKNLVETYDFKSLNGMNINKFLRVKDGSLYVGTEHGIIKIQPNRAEHSEFFTEENGLPNNMVSGLFEDREGNLWISMEYGGIGKFTRRNFFDVTKAAYLPEENINSVLEDADKNLWLGGDSGLSCIKSDKISRERAEQIDAVIENLNGIRIRQIREEKDGSVYFATYSDRGLLKFSADGTVTTLTQKDGLPNNKIRFSYRDASGALWIGTTAGPAVYYDGKITRIGQEQGLPNMFILCALQTKSGEMWLGTDGGGAVKITLPSSPSADINIKIEEVFSKQNGLCGNIVFRVTEDKAGNLWFSTGEGLSLYKDGTFYNAAHALEISGKSVYNLLCDSKGNLWIMLPNELLLVRADSLTKAVINAKPAEGLIRYNKLDGLSGQPAANAWAHLSETDTLFVPTLKGVSVCDPGYDVFNKLPPPVVMENILLDDNPLEPPDDKLIIPADTKRIIFRFAALSYTIPQRVNFQYKLEGYDKDWISSNGSEKEIGYTNLYPKNYTFKVRAANNDGIVNVNGAEVSFYQKPFFYQTVWFYIVAAVFLSGLIISIVQLKLRQLKRIAEMLDKKVREKTKDLAAEKEKSDKLLKNMLPLFVIDELKQTGKSTPKLYPAVTIMFADLANFTEWASSNSAEDVIRELNKMFTHFDNIINRCGCERIKTLGDGYMACCGLRGETDHAQKIVGAAVEILTSFNKTDNYGIGKGIHIGIASGSITGGIVGEHKYIFDIFGDTVNTAFRLESVTVPMACTVSRKTAQLIDGRFPLIERPERELKGKGKLSSFYVVYKGNKDTAIHDIKMNRFLYKKLEEAFLSKDFTQCRKFLAGFNRTLLEPEQLRNIEKIEKFIKT